MGLMFNSRKKGDVKRTGKLQSEKAQAVEAAWVERGNRKTKLYQQTHIIMQFFALSNMMTMNSWLL